MAKVLIEVGDALLKEDGGFILLESTPTAPIDGSIEVGVGSFSGGIVTGTGAFGGGIETAVGAFGGGIKEPC